MRILLIDTCGPSGSVALAEAGEVVAMERLAERAASAELMPAIGRLQVGRGWESVDAVGVVSGPGSFTGVRVGLATAKGLCEGMGARLVAVSRLQVLFDEAGPAAGIAVLDAGRGEVYARGADGVERLMRRDDLAPGEGVRVVVAEPQIAAALADLRAELVEIDAGSALRCVERALEGDAVDAALVDANYVRGERDIYAKRAAAGPA